MVYGLEYTNDILSNVRGGTRTGTIDQGKLHGILTVDFGKLAGWDGLSLFGNFFQIHNTGRIRRDYVGGINTIAAIEALPTTRFPSSGLNRNSPTTQASLRVGQLAADTEFFYSELSTMFLQSDWPTIAAVNLPSGGAAYPLSTPGVRFKVNPVKDLSGFGSRCSTATQPGPARAMSSCAIATASTSASTIRRSSSARPSTSITTVRRTQALPPRSSSAPGVISDVQRPALCHRTARCWPIPLAPAFRSSIAAIPASMRSSTSNSTDRTAATRKAAFRCSAACRSVRPTAI